MTPLRLTWLTNEFAICRLDPGAPPAWAMDGEFWAITRTSDELSIVVEKQCVPAGVRHDPGWVCLKVAGPLDFGLTGILASLAAPLAEAGVSIFALSTFDTDFVLVKRDQKEKAGDALRAAGHTVT